MKFLSALMALAFSMAAGMVQAEGFTLSSADVSGQLSNKEVFNSFGCKGENISPQLTWKNAPEGTKSFAVTVYDPDAPTGSGWWHWVIFDISVKTNALKSNAGNVIANLAPEGSVQSVTSFGAPGFGGACPPEGHGPHQYLFTVYALKVDKLGLDAKANPELVGYYLNANKLGKAAIVAYYER